MYNSIQVSIIIPCRNEEKYIGKCLEAVLGQEYPQDKLEIIVVDGMSEDASIEIVRKFIEDHPNIALYKNPAQTAPVALNIGIQKAKGEIIIGISAHSSLERNYIERCIHFLEKTGVDCVGGVLETVGKSYLGETIALVLSSPFGVGGARFRYTQKAGYVDTVAYGAYRREVFDKIGLFDERLVRNQDIEFNSRLRKAGGKIYLTPEIKSYYYCPETIGKFCRQAFSNGLWNIKTARLVKGAMRPRHFVPLFFVIILIVGSILALFWILGKIALAAIVISYFLLAFIFSLIIAFKEGFRYFLVLPLIFLLLHLSYGIGSLIGITKWFGDIGRI